ncbi:MAG: GNAT family N-acetyltransferase [Hyphomonadaceae bacterium]|nr:GNAT family N-acetyltransferase [Hyphomonadaceae bacterium]
MDITIREAVAAEALEIAAVRIAAAEDLTARFGKGFWSSNTTENGVLFAMKRGRVIVAVQNAAIVGTLTLSTFKPWAIDKSYFTKVKTPIYLTSMAISPKAQRLGVGRAMLAQADVLARKWPGQAIRLDAFDADAGAADFYVRCGYTERGRAVFRTAPLIYFERLLIPPAL